MEDYIFLEHTADLKFKAYGRTLSECYKNCALAVFHSLTDPGNVECTIKKQITLKAEDLEILLHDFLAELLFLFETESIIFGCFDVSVEKEGIFKLKATAEGEKYNPDKHMLETHIKAVTYHEMSVEKKDGLWTAQVICDI